MKKRMESILALVCTAVVCITDDIVASPYCVLLNATGLTDGVETIPAVVEEWKDK